MNKKLIAAAVSAAVVAPVTAQAADVTVYGRINNAIEMRDVDGGDSTVDVSSISSRFGIKASSDMGNGMTATARYEFATVTDKELPNPADLRIGTVGISGGFGSITIGNQWSAYYDTIGTDIDPTYTIGYVLYSSVTGGPYRGSNTIKYANSFGPVYLELDVRLNESGEGSDVAEKINGDGIGVGARWAVTDNWTIAAAHDSEDGVDGGSDVDRTGFSTKFTFGGFFGILGWHEIDRGGEGSINHTQLWGGTDIGDATSLMVGYGIVDDESGADPTALNIGVYHKMGGGLRLYYEGGFHDFDGGARGTDFDRHVFGMRIDF